MSGILDSKSRIIDALLTPEGRSRMAKGEFNVSFVTFSDYGVSYIPDLEDGHVDPAGKIYLEACVLPQDQITFEANDEGKLVGFRNQDIKLKTDTGNIPSSAAEGRIVNGRLVAYQYHHGRRVKVSTIQENPADDGKGFVYSDSSGLTGSILVKSTLGAGTFEANSPIPGGPFVAYVGTAGGSGPQQFAQVISGAISKLDALGGPSVPVSVVNDSVYLDSGQTSGGTKIFCTGSLSSPLLIESSAIGGNLLVDELEDSSFASQIQGILTSSFDNFSDLQSISSINRLFEDDQFQLSVNEMTFDLSKINTKIVDVLRQSPPTLNSIDSLFSDEKLSHLDNFLYLPPIVKTSDTKIPDKTNVDSLKPYLLGNYPSWGDNEKKLTFSKLSKQVSDFQDIQPPIFFDKTSRGNRIIGQIFEVTGKSVTKLDVVDFGSMKNEASEDVSVTNRVFFVGKTFLDNRGTACFVNMFTLVFSKNSQNDDTDEVAK